MPLNDSNMTNRLIQIAAEAAQAAGKEIMRVFAAGHPEMVSGDEDAPVTRADRLSDIIIREQLLQTGLPVLSEEDEMVPYEERKDWEYFWLVDPLDGTKEFIKGLDEFTVNIALIHKKMPLAGVIYLPSQEILYQGGPDTGVIRVEQGHHLKLNPLLARIQLPGLICKPGVRVVSSRSHHSDATQQFIRQFNDPLISVAGSSVKFIQLLDGRADIYPRFEPCMEWDTAAGHALLRLTNRGVYHTDMSTELLYNKPDLTNPSFVAL